MSSHLTNSASDPASKRSVLVIDDSALMLATVKRSLEASGFDVRTALDAQDALVGAFKDPPDVIVCDLQMPVIDGIGVIHAVGGLSPPPPVIVQSKDSDISAILSALRAGAFDYVVKSGAFTDALRASVERAVRHAFVLRENRRLGAELARRVAELEAEARSRMTAEDALRLAQEQALVNKATEESLRWARDQAIAGTRAKSAFLANMSHELRTPLNAILGYAELVADDLSDNNHPSIPDVERIIKASQHLLALINNVLDLAKIEAGHQNLQIAPLDVPSMIEQVRATVLPLTTHGKNTLVVSCGAISMRADEVKLRQCLLNLVSNAAKFTTKGTIRLEAIEERDANDQPWVRFDVSDTGIGMTREQSDRVFDAFEQADSGAARTYGGTGLGLTITRNLVQLMGGSISVATSLGEGSTFSIRLPMDPPHQEADVGAA